MKYSAMFLMLLMICITAREGYGLHDLFKELDRNKDGKIDRSEFSEDMKKDAFNKLDKDQNRELSPEEWEGSAGMEEQDKHRELFTRIDKDKNKRISFFEFSDYADNYSNIEKAFIGLDKDGSNSLSPDEITMRPLFKWITIRW